jgi:hypothetical protein
VKDLTTPFGPYSGIIIKSGPYGPTYGIVEEKGGVWYTEDEAGPNDLYGEYPVPKDSNGYSPSLGIRGDGLGTEALDIFDEEVRGEVLEIMGLDPSGESCLVFRRDPPLEPGSMGYEMIAMKNWKNDYENYLARTAKVIRKIIEEQPQWRKTPEKRPAKLFNYRPAIIFGLPFVSSKPKPKAKWCPKKPVTKLAKKDYASVQEAIDEVPNYKRDARVQKYNYIMPGHSDLKGQYLLRSQKKASPPDDDEEDGKPQGKPKNSRGKR